MKTHTHVILFLILFSCKENKEISKHESIINKVLGTQLEIPSNLTIYDCSNNYKSDSLSIINSKFQIYSSINASCGTCVNNINHWIDLKETFEVFNTSIILILHSENNFEYLKYLCESDQIKTINFPLFLDNDNELIKSNTFMQKHKHFETVLTNKDNNIIALGNPVVSKEFEKIFLNIIKKNQGTKFFIHKT